MRFCKRPRLFSRARRGRHDDTPCLYCCPCCGLSSARVMPPVGCGAELVLCESRAPGLRPLRVWRGGCAAVFSGGDQADFQGKPWDLRRAAHSCWTPQRRHAGLPKDCGQDHEAERYFPAPTQKAQACDHKQKPRPWHCTEPCWAPVRYHTTQHRLACWYYICRHRWKMALRRCRQGYGDLRDCRLEHGLHSVLAERALLMAIQRHHPPKGLIQHSDRGVQYASGPYRKILADHKLVASMSRKGNCFDNAPMESFFGSLKNELVHRTRFKTREEARRAIFECIEVWYNRQRRHSSLGYITPEQARQRFMTGTKIAA